MSKNSNNKGRAYEFAYLMTLYEKISQTEYVVIDKNTGYDISKKAWDKLSLIEQSIYLSSALASINTIFDLEPLILEQENDVRIKIQTDDMGQTGDVRDILITRQDIQWEIGLSIKHNHFAVKHSRLSQKLDFGTKWYGEKCSINYWNSVNKIFNYLNEEKKKNKLWNELLLKEDNVYVPILTAFKNEINYQYSNNIDIPKLMIEYLLGKFDFYKIISIDKKRTTQIQSFNLKGMLNKEGVKIKKRIMVPIIKLPTKIISLDFKPNSKSTLELYLDEDWQFSFRIHNASSKVETSLKFDIQIISMPTTIIPINNIWNKDSI